LTTLIELKLASGMTNIDRGKDLVDVQELVKLLGLSADFSAELNPYVRDKYRELWTNVYGRAKRFFLLWRDDDAPETLKAMLNDGVLVEPRENLKTGYVYLVSTDPDIARKYDMHDEDEMMPDE